ncbi:MAG: DUF1028 domain-containing protein [Actinomycetota bacterium]|nr:DUF1028 domain-containing protein [Actinomycetota bacterium]
MTYSIVARDPATGELGVAVQSHYFGVGPVVPWLRPGVGAVATQAMVEIAYGPRTLDLLAAGHTPQAALDELTAADEAAAIRQVATVDVTGAVATHTGSRCIAEAGHRNGDGWSVQANMMTNPTVPDAMAAAYLGAGDDGDLASRLLAALDAAEDAGGDIRGRQSAALVVVGGDAGLPAWDRIYDVRVDDSPEPLVELRRLVGMRRAYRTVATDDPVLGPNPELRFWTALQLASKGDVVGARGLLDAVYAVDGRWRELLRRLPAAGQFPDDPALVSALTDP